MPVAAGLGAPRGGASQRAANARAAAGPRGAASAAVPGQSRCLAKRPLAASPAGSRPTGAPTHPPNHHACSPEIQVPIRPVQLGQAIKVHDIHTRDKAGGKGGAGQGGGCGAGGACGRRRGAAPCQGWAKKHGVRGGTLTLLAQKKVPSTASVWLEASLLWDTELKTRGTSRGRGGQGDRGPRLGAGRSCCWPGPRTSASEQAGKKMARRTACPHPGRRGGWCAQAAPPGPPPP